MKQSSTDMREWAIEAWKSGTAINDICNVLGITRKTFYNWRKRESEGGEQTPLPKGRPLSILNEYHLSRIQLLYDMDNSLYAREIMIKLDLDCHRGVIYRALANLGLTYKKRDKGVATRSTRDTTRTQQMGLFL